MKKVNLIIFLSFLMILLCLGIFSQTNVSNTGTSSIRPKIAINDGGDTMVIWQEELTGDDKIYYSIKKLDGNWKNAKVIPGQQGNCTVPDIFRYYKDFSVVWHNTTRNTIELTRYKRADDSWINITTVDSGSSSENARVITTTNDRIAVAWQERTPSKFNALVRVRNSNGKWNSPTNVSDSNYTSKYLDMYPGPSGKIYVVWQQKTPLGDGDNIKEPQMNIENGNGTWQGKFDVNNINEKCYRPAVAVTADNTVLCAFFRQSRQSFYGSIKKNEWTTSSIGTGNWQEHDKYYSDAASTGDGLVFVYKDSGGYIRYIAYDDVGLQTNQINIHESIESYPPRQSYPANWGESKSVGKGTYPTVDWFWNVEAAVGWQYYTGGNNEIMVKFVELEGGGGQVGEPPVAEFTHSPAKGVVPMTVHFDASNSNDPDGTIEDYNWRFGDGAYGKGMTTSHTYKNKGNYTIRLKVTDNDGNTDKAYGEVEVLQSVFSPLNQKYKRLTNRSLFTYEYLYEVTWESNPNNGNYGINVVKYNIYRRLKGTGSYQKIDEVSSRVFQYYDRSLGTEKIDYQYQVTAQDEEGRESKLK